MTPLSPHSRVVLITGAAGGLGQALIKIFASTQATIIAGWHQHQPAFPQANVHPVPLNVTRPDQINSAVQQIILQHHRIDVLINNAGITDDHPVWSLSNPAWNTVMDVNLKGAFQCSRAVLPFMIRRRQGHIVNLSSFSGRVGQRGQANYAAAKAGLFGLTSALAREVGSRNIKVNAVLPGVLPTPMTEQLDAQTLKSYAKANALNRLNDPDEVARFIAFLTTLSNVSGQLFQLDSRPAPWS